ncbi:DUF2235 domain-containing protein [Duganella sp. BJB1802]|uniref:T6SS phospholipase effector Tle1-like catalytic domain-containing protein n=1 Tax=Duganella sp. BJB1802 TaxID=2744575 RepID=UPI001593C5FA|nr:DUF2235 domain-containing protein [Duganella sp. BJB1802]NVD71788.1 DUF2235 domain-containing protein [Duganella sp. BJB1802]
MTKNQNKDSVGDSKTPPLKPDAASLRHAVDQSVALPAEAAQKARVTSPAASAALAAPAESKGKSTNCHQIVSMSFFFDGTGNNMDADSGTLKHSNVAKLYNVHQPDDKTQGIYRIYLPGVGTYFAEVGDDGGGKPGLVSGYLGDSRLDWALKQFDEKLKPHVARATSPSNTIEEINIFLFGFSRGAALARAFANKLLEDRCVYDTGKKCRLKKGGFPFRIRFMGLFDTVASVGLPMSSNNTSITAAVTGTVRDVLDRRLESSSYKDTLPQALAFAERSAPGADPAPGTYDGHSDWGGSLAIPDLVEEVRHFIAAHEIRNSFPADSLSVLAGGQVVKPERFHESVYPGVHSDVGGSYRPGEGARSFDAAEKLGLIPLHSMYNFAIAAKVPLLPKTAWRKMNESDFEISGKLIQRYNYYQAKIGLATNLGTLMNRHMALYFAWRFHAIHKKQQGDKTEAAEIDRVNKEFGVDKVKLDQEISVLENKNKIAQRAVYEAQRNKERYIQNNYGNPNIGSSKKFDDDINTATAEHKVALDNLLRAKAKLDALPKMGNYANMVAMYDNQLIQDVNAIRRAYSKVETLAKNPSVLKRENLRPHYKILIEAYENEYVHNKGLKDEEIIAFFDQYVHDSLSGFATDATLPSDPRVIYLGGDEKYRYAINEPQQRSDDLQYA